MAKRKVRLGQPIQRNEVVLDMLSEITQADIDRASILWRDNAPRRFHNLLIAEPEPDELTDAGTL